MIMTINTAGNISEDNNDNNEIIMNFLINAIDCN